MLKLLGALLLLGGCVAVGIEQVKLLDGRVKGLRSVLQSLEIMEQELNYRLPPMDELLSIAAERSALPASKFLHACSEKLVQELGKPLFEFWSQCARENLSVLKRDDMECIIALGGVLGRYDGESQCKAISRTRETLTNSLASAIEERGSKGKLYGVLGTAAGVFLVILLL